MRRTIAAAALTAVASMVGCAPTPVAGCGGPPPASAPGWQRSFRAGCLDPRGRLAGGSEVLHLIGHAGKLYAAVGYWMDPRNPWYGGSTANGAWAQILRLDSPDGAWQVDLDMPRHLRAEVLRSVTFRTDGSGRALPDPVTLLLAAAYEGNGEPGINLFTRDDATGGWTESRIIPGTPGMRGETNSVRALRVHRDAVTGVDRLFVTAGRHGVYSGTYDPSLPGRVRWDAEPELGPLPVRPLAMTEANGALLMPADRTIYQRTDGPHPAWRAIYSVEDPGHGATQSPVGGIRGLTAIPGPSGPGQSLLFVWAPDGHSRGGVMRLDPEGGGRYRQVEEAAIAPLVARTLGTRVPFVLAAYNDILRLSDPATGQTSDLIGLEAWVPSGSSPTVQGKPGGTGGYYAGALYVMRDRPDAWRVGEVNGRYRAGDPPLEATRTYAVSPFAEDGGRVVYFGGFDCNFERCPDRGWVFRGDIKAVLSDR